MSEFRETSKKYFSNATDSYSRLKDISFLSTDTVNNQESLDFVKSLDIDIICFLGGDIAKEKFINSPRLACLNFHTGLSPIYNGTRSYLWPVIEGRPNLVGGTLMLMSPKIDSGEILGHILPEIKKNDTSADLFMRMIIGSVDLYAQCVKRMVVGKNETEALVKVAQRRSLRYTEYRHMDWTQELKLRAFYESGKMSRYVRDEKFIFPTSTDRLFVRELLDNVLNICNGIK